VPHTADLLVMTFCVCGQYILVVFVLIIHDVVVSAAVDGGKLIGYFNLPWFAWGSAEMNLGDTVEYNTLVRVTSPYDRLATSIIKLFVHYNVWSTVYLGSTALNEWLCVTSVIVMSEIIMISVGLRIRFCHTRHVAAKPQLILILYL